MLRQRYILVTIIIIVGLIWGWGCNMFYDSNLMELQVKAKQIFIDALNTEMRSRNIPKGLIHSNVTSEFLLKPEYPDSVYIIDETGKSYYKFYIEKHNNSTTYDIELRGLQTCTFGKNQFNQIR